MKSLSIALCFFFGVISNSTFASANNRKSILVSIVDYAGKPIQVSLEVDKPFNKHAELISDATSQQQVDCLIFGFVSKCLEMKHLYINDDLAKIYHNDRLVFLRPISLVAIWLSGRREDKDFGKLLSEVAGERQPVPIPRAGKTVVFYDTVIGDEYFVSTYDTSFERVESVQDGALALKRLDDLVGHDFPTECPAPDMGRFSEGTYCSGVFHWSSQNKLTGHAWCKYTRVAMIVSAPWDCVALSYLTPSQAYIRAFPSPFYGAGFGQGTPGILCSGDPPIPFNASQAALISDLLAAEPFSMNMQSPRRAGSTFFQLAGQRLNLRSKVLPGVFESTTLTLTVADGGGTEGLVIAGEAVLTVSGQLQQERSGYSEPDGAMMDKYKEYLIGAMSNGLSALFHQKVTCYYN